MVAVVTSTDTPEAIQAALGAKNVRVTDDAGNDVTKPNPEGADKDKADKGDAAEGEDKDNAANSDDKSDDKNSSDSAAGGEDKDDTKDDKGDKGDTAVQKRIDKLTSKIGDLEAQLADATKPKGDDKQDKGTPAADAAKDDIEPKPEDFDTTADYFKALTKWSKAQLKKELKADADADAQKVANAQVVDRWNKQIESAKAKYKDFDEVMGDTVIGKPVARALVESPDGAELAYYIGKHPEKAKGLKDLKQDREIGIAIGELRAEIRLSTKSDKKDDANKGSDNQGKPKPINPVGGSGKGGNVEDKIDTNNYQAYKAKRNKDIAAKSQRRA